VSLKNQNKGVEVFNIGSEDQIDVKTIASIVAEEMGCKGIRFKFTGGVEGGRGWIGDVKTMLLDISKLKKLGWKPKLNSKEAVRKATQDLLNHN
jgi:UDP-glucose 4-epimerase